MLYELIWINEIEQRAKIIFLSVVVTLTSAALISLHIFMFFQALFFATTCFKVISIAYLKCFML